MNIESVHYIRDHFSHNRVHVQMMVDHLWVETSVAVPDRLVTDGVLYRALVNHLQVKCIRFMAGKASVRAAFEARTDGPGAPHSTVEQAGATVAGQGFYRQR